MNKKEIKNFLMSLRTKENDAIITGLLGQIDMISEEDITKKIQGMSEEKIKEFLIGLVNDEVNKKSEVDYLRKQIVEVPKENPYFGEVYKTYIIHILGLYEEIVSSDISVEQKRMKFESELARYLAEHMTEMSKLMAKQTSNEQLIKLAPSELHLGSKSLNYDTVGNLYNTFVNDLNIVSNDSEGKMYCTVPNEQRIFEEPVLDENGNVRINANLQYNFDMIKETYDFAKKHDKQIKFHTFLWHNAVPENLKREVDQIEDPVLKRKMALEFLRSYATQLSKFIKDNGYDLRQIEGLNEIASDIPGDETLENSWWKDVIGKNPETGDEYFIDVLKILRESFPETEIIYNEYNEFVGHKTDKICKILEHTRAVEERDGISLLDGIGLQAHYADWNFRRKAPLTEKDIVESAVKLQKACADKKIFITEFDFLNIRKNGAKEQLEQTFMEIYSKISNGFIMWGQSDSLTWYHCIDKNGNNMHAQIISSDGKPKRIYEQYREKFFEPRIPQEIKSGKIDSVK